MNPLVLGTLSPDVKFLLCLAVPVLFLAFLAVLHLGYLDKKDGVKKPKSLGAGCDGCCGHCTKDH